MKTEFEFIHNIKKKYSLNLIGDDCAVLSKDDQTDMVITSDMLVEDIDFRFDWTTPEFLGHKALAVSLSDIAAMAAAPKWAMISLAVPSNIWESGFVERLYEGWFRLADQFGVELIGGDVSGAADKLTIDSIAGGEVSKGRAILRSGASAGDLVFVSGSLGGASCGLQLLEHTNYETQSISRPMQDLIDRQTQPKPRLDLARQLGASGIVSSMIDISDGLSSDLAHICSSSSVGARIDYSLIPKDPNLKYAPPASLESTIQFVLNGGEDFELLFTVPSKKTSALKDLPVTRIGEITSNSGNIELIRDGKVEILEPKGYRHF